MDEIFEAVRPGPPWHANQIFGLQTGPQGITISNPWDKPKVKRAVSHSSIDVKISPVAELERYSEGYEFPALSRTNLTCSGQPEGACQEEGMED